MTKLNEESFMTKSLIFLLVFVTPLIQSNVFANECKNKFYNASYKKNLTKKSTKKSDPFNLGSFKPHFARDYGEQFNLRRAQRNLSALTGRVNIDCNGCVPGRETFEQKERVRQFIISKLESLGLKPRVEEYVYSRQVIKPYSSQSIVTPIDIHGMNDKELSEMWNSKTYSDLREWLVEKEEQNDDPNTLRLFDLDDWIQLRKDIDEYKEEKKSGLSNLFTSTPDKRMALFDLNRLINGIKAFNEKTEPEPDKVIEKRAYNVVVEIDGNSLKDEIFELNAHYDTTGESKPGADDNGSGVITLLEVAEIFSNSRPQRTIRLVFADLEERGFIGTNEHVQNVVEQGDNIIGAIVIDTIGFAPIGPRYSTKPPFVVELGTSSMHKGSESYNSSRELAEAIAYQHARYTDRYASLSIETSGALPGTADHGPYWRNGVPAILVAAPYEGDAINPGYHLDSDVAEQFNWGYYTDVSQTIIETTALVSNPVIFKQDDDVVQYNNQIIDTSVSHMKQRSPEEPKPFQPKGKSKGKGKNKSKGKGKGKDAPKQQENTTEGLFDLDFPL